MITVLHSRNKARVLKATNTVLFHCATVASNTNCQITLIIDQTILGQVVFQSNANHPLAESTDNIKFEVMYIFYFDLDLTFTLMCDLDLINNL